MCLLPSRTSGLHTKHMTLSKWQTHKHLWNTGAVIGISIWQIPILQRNLSDTTSNFLFCNVLHVLQYYKVDRYFIALMGLCFNIAHFSSSKSPSFFFFN